MGVSDRLATWSVSCLVGWKNRNREMGLLIVLAMSALSSTTHAIEEDYGYEFADDPLAAGGFVT